MSVEVAIDNFDAFYVVFVSRVRECLHSFYEFVSLSVRTIRDIGIAPFYAVVCQSGESGAKCRYVRALSLDVLC